jgi:5-methylcytosine-specific restriction enzyme A
MTHEDRYRSGDPDRQFLQSRVWRERIRPAQMRREPLSRFCRALDIVRIGEQVDHITRPRGDFSLQRDPRNFQTLCGPHHGAKSKWEGGNTSKPLVIGTRVDGWVVTATGGTIPFPGEAD